MPPKKAVKKHRKLKNQKPSYFYMAVMKTKPLLADLAKIVWRPFPYGKPDWKIITIEDGAVDTKNCHLSRGFMKYGPDWVSWFNKDNREHVIQFLNGQWPFDQPADPGDQTVDVPANGPSVWCRLSKSSGATGFTVSYPYGVNEVPGTPGPEISSDD